MPSLSPFTSPPTISLRLINLDDALMPHPWHPDSRNAAIDRTVADTRGANGIHGEA
jgi:hypothetical protein